MRKNKYGFTLGEVLVSLAVIGIIMALAAHTIKLAKSSYTAVTYHAYNNVTAIVGELKAGERIALDKNKNKLPLAHMQCRTSENGSITTILAPDYRSHIVPLCKYAGNPEKNGGSGAADMLFCKNTIYFANTKGKTFCDENHLSGVDFDKTTNEPKINIGNWAEPNFIATNGYRYYFSKWYYFNDAYGVVSDKYGFRIIAVDINGANGPNTTEFDAKTEILPDIVQFLVLDNGEIYPIGPAGNNITVGTGDKARTVTYLNTRVKAYYFRDDDKRTENVSSSCIERNADGSISHTCNFAVLYSKNSKGDSFFSFKEAFCYSKGKNLPTYISYCDDYPVEADNLCPPSDSPKTFDECTTKIIKPVFRYNFK